MFVEWRQIDTFDCYSVSEEGSVRNDRTNRDMSRFSNQKGIAYVSLTQDRKQHTRAIAPLVAAAFLEVPQNDHFDSLIHLDGDRQNLFALNLLWRPRWFVIKYNWQFEEPPQQNYHPIEDMETGERFYNPWIAATKYGLLRSDILRSVMNGIEVWPTRQRFKSVSFMR